MIYNFPSNKKFLHQLRQVSPDMDSIVSRIEIETKAKKLREVYIDNPFQNNPDGTKTFKITSNTDPDINLLDIFSTVEDIQNYLIGQFYKFQETESGLDLLFSIDGQLPKFTKKVHMYPDTNIILDPQAKPFVYRLGSIKGIHIDTLPIINNELQQGGIRKKFGDTVPEVIYRGQQILEQRCENLRPEDKSELNLLYDIIMEQFKNQEEQLIELASTKHDAKILAKEYGSQHSEEYQRMVVKTIENIREGNGLNHLADRIMTTTSFGYNFMYPDQKSMIVSNDQDLLALQELFYDQVLPTYLATTVMNTAKKKNPDVAQQLTPDRLFAASKEHIIWARDEFPSHNSTVGLVYLPRENKFASKQVATPLLVYFAGVSSYRSAKCNLIAQMSLTNQTPDEIIRRLMKPVIDVPSADLFDEEWDSAYETPIPPSQYMNDQKSE